MNPLPLLLAALTLSAQGETVSPKFRHALPNVPGKEMVSVVIDYRPGATSAPHRHAPSAFIYAYVLSGSIRSQLEGEAAPKVYHAGEGWFENPGAHHIVSANASETQPASLLAVFVVDPDQALTVHDLR